MTFMGKQLAIKLFLRVGIKPRKATEEHWQHAKAVLRKHNDLAMAEYRFRQRVAANG